MFAWLDECQITIELNDPEKKKKKTKKAAPKIQKNVMKHVIL